LEIASQVWFIISIGWLVSILAGFLNVYAAYAAWIVWPNLVGIWGSYKRNQLRAAESMESIQHVKTKNKKQKVAG
jgi:hypothetical protein